MRKVIIPKIIQSKVSVKKIIFLRGVKFIDDIEKVEWYRGEGKSLIIVCWKGVPKYLQHTNRRAGIGIRIATGPEVHISAARHTQKK